MRSWAFLSFDMNKSSNGFLQLEYSQLFSSCPSKQHDVDLKQVQDFLSNFFKWKRVFQFPSLGSATKFLTPSVGVVWKAVLKCKRYSSKDSIFRNKTNDCWKIKYFRITTELLHVHWLSMTFGWELIAVSVYLSHLDQSFQCFSIDRIVADGIHFYPLPAEWIHKFYS